MSATQRNFLDRCPAQLAERITLLAKKIGRNPSHEDFKNEYGRGVFDAVRHVYGTWTNAKAFCGFGALNRTGVEHVLTALATWRDANGRLPTAGEVQMRSKAPALPAYKTILKAFGVETWAAAMSSVEAHLRKAS